MGWFWTNKIKKAPARTLPAKPDGGMFAGFVKLMEDVKSGKQREELVAHIQEYYERLADFYRSAIKAEKEFCGDNLVFTRDMLEPIDLMRERLAADTAHPVHFAVPEETVLELATTLEKSICALEERLVPDRRDSEHAIASLRGKIDRITNARLAGTVSLCAINAYAVKNNSRSV